MSLNPILSRCVRVYSFTSYCNNIHFNIITMVTVLTRYLPLDFQWKSFCWEIQWKTPSENRIREKGGNVKLMYLFPVSFVSSFFISPFLPFLRSSLFLPVTGNGPRYHSSRLRMLVRWVPRASYGSYSAAKVPVFTPRPNPPPIIT